MGEGPRGGVARGPREKGWERWPEDWARCWADDEGCSCWWRLWCADLAFLADDDDEEEEYSAVSMAKRLGLEGLLRGSGGVTSAGLGTEFLLMADLGAWWWAAWAAAPSESVVDIRRDGFCVGTISILVSGVAWSSDEILATTSSRFWVHIKKRKEKKTVRFELS